MLDEQPRTHDLDHSARELFAPAQWPLLPLPRDGDDLGKCLLEILRSEAGRLVLNSLVHTYLLRVDQTLSAERNLGRQDVVRHMLEWVGAGLLSDADTRHHGTLNPWRMG